MYIKIYTYICTNGRMLLYYLIQKVGVVLCQQTWIDGLCTTPRSPLHTGALGNGFSHGNPIYWWSLVWKLFNNERHDDYNRRWTTKRQNISSFQQNNGYLFEFIFIYNFMIIFIFELQKTEGHNNRFLAASRFPALQPHGIQGPVMDGCKLQDLKASRRCLLCPWGGMGVGWEWNPCPSTKLSGWKMSLLGCTRKLGSMVSKWVITYL